MFLGKMCFDNDEHDLFIRWSTQTKIEIDLSELKSDDKLLKLENKFTELVYFRHDNKI